MNWVVIRYKTKRGAKQKVTVADVGDNVKLTIEQLTKGKCHSITMEAR